MLAGLALVSARTKMIPLWLTGHPRPDSATVSKVVPSKAKERVEGEIISITPHGFEPTEITHSHKHFVLIIDNRSGLSEVNLSLKRQQGEKLRDVQIRREKRNWSDDLNLEPGRYLLSEANHPDWISHITIATEK
jgi:hypothetical protein